MGQYRVRTFSECTSDQDIASTGLAVPPAPGARRAAQVASRKFHEAGRLHGSRELIEAGCKSALSYLLFC